MATRLLTVDELRGIYTAPETARLVASRGEFNVQETEVVELAILDGEDEAVSILRGRYTDDEIPATPETTSRRLKVLVAALAWYNLHRHFQVTPGKVLADRDDARKALQSISYGEMSLLLTDDPAVDSGRPVVSSIRRPSTIYEQPMTLERMDGWGHER